MLGQETKILLHSGHPPQKKETPEVPGYLL